MSLIDNLYSKKHIDVFYAQAMSYLIIALLLLIPGLHDDGYLPLGYSGLWSITQDENAYGGSYMQTETGTLTFSFSGSGFALYGTQSDSGGTADVCVNEDDCLSVSWNAVTTLYRVGVISIGGLGDGVHTVTIAADDNGIITIDAVYIAPHAIAQREPEPTPGWIAPNEDGTGATVNLITSGDQSIFIMLTALTVLVFVSVTVQIFRWSR